MSNEAGIALEREIGPIYLAMAPGRVSKQLLFRLGQATRRVLCRDHARGLVRISALNRQSDSLFAHQHKPTSNAGSPTQRGLQATTGARILD